MYLNGTSGHPGRVQSSTGRLAVFLDLLRLMFYRDFYRKRTRGKETVAPG